MRERYPADPMQDQGATARCGLASPQLLPRGPPARLVEAGAQDEEHMRLIDEIGTALGDDRSADRPRPRPLGAITFVAAESGRNFDENDLRLAEELAARCAVAVDNARLFRERTPIARTLQESLLPPELPQLPGPRGGGALPRRRGGLSRWAATSTTCSTRATTGWAAVIGDVCGKGAEAAAITALARYTLRAAAMTDDLPSRILATLNEAMLRQRTDRRFSTVLYASIDRRNGDTALRFSSGGHPLPLVLRAEGDVVEVGTPGTLLGIVSDPDLHDAEVGLRPGDAVVLYTDGVTDAAAPEDVHEPEELAAVLGGRRYESADAIAEALMSLAMSSANGEGGPRDDIAILVIRVVEPQVAPLSQ